jgi:hypothetical protein
MDEGCEAMDIVDRLNKEHDDTLIENIRLEKENISAMELVVSLKKENKKLRQREGYTYDHNVRLLEKLEDEEKDNEKNEKQSAKMVSQLSSYNYELMEVIKKLEGPGGRFSDE